jgi:hypothetical protein
MEKINTITDLDRAILLLESKQAIEEKELKEQFQLTYESLKPLNILKNVFKKAAESNDLKENIVNNSIGLTVGYLSKMMFEKTTKSPIKKILGNVVLFGVTKIVENNTEFIMLLLDKLLKKINQKKNQ